jgi:hypothetical protein
VGHGIAESVRFVFLSGLIAATAMLIFVSSNSTRRRILLVTLLVAFLAAYPMGRFFLGGIGLGNRTVIYAGLMFAFSPWIYVAASILALVGQRVLRGRLVVPAVLAKDPWPRYSIAVSLALLVTWFSGFNIVGLLRWYGGVRVSELIGSIPYVHLWSIFVIDAVLISLLLGSLRVERWWKFDAQGAGIVAFGNTLLLGAMLFRQFAWVAWYDDGEVFGRLLVHAAILILVLGLIIMCPFWPWNLKAANEMRGDRAAPS